MKLYVGNLSFATSEEELQDLFAQQGTVTSVSIIKDRDTGRSKGFGFVEFESSDAGNSAISEYDGYDFNGRNIRVSEAREKPRGGAGGGHRRGGGGGGNRRSFDR
ncbi:MAG: RNA-binding protein [Bdellovibrionaceae bacterium]|nr:RNA-binding protein [Pseudobdellovibrionaceae bacterium]|tara:strand:- start:455 stop:769 length:315 start_codon:yes stop_codon:yes gene_type:complete